MKAPASRSWSPTPRLTGAEGHELRERPAASRGSRPAGTGAGTALRAAESNRGRPGDCAARLRRRGERRQCPFCPPRSGAADQPGPAGQIPCFHGDAPRRRRGGRRWPRTHAVSRGLARLRGSVGDWP